MTVDVSCSCGNEVVSFPTTHPSARFAELNMRASIRHWPYSRFCERASALEKERERYDRERIGLTRSFYEHPYTDVYGRGFSVILLRTLELKSKVTVCEKTASDLYRLWCESWGVIMIRQHAVIHVAALAVEGAVCGPAFNAWRGPFVEIKHECRCGALVGLNRQVITINSARYL